MEALTLTGEGIVVAAAMGLLFALFGWQLWWLFIAGMLLFLVLSTIVTRLGRGYKRRKRLDLSPRGLPNVIANGAVPLAMAGLYRLAALLGAERYAMLCLFGFIASVAAITADKFASEIGVLDGMPVSLLGGRRVQKGVSGGVTWVGLAASAVGAAIIASVLVPLSMPYGLTPGLYVAAAVVVLCGFLGGLVDSALGYYEEKGIGNKFTSNFACSLVGAMVGIAIAAIL